MFSNSYILLQYILCCTPKYNVFIIKFLVLGDVFHMAFTRCYCCLICCCNYCHESWGCNYIPSIDSFTLIQRLHHCDFGHLRGLIHVVVLYMHKLDSSSLDIILKCKLIETWVPLYHFVVIFWVSKKLWRVFHGILKYSKWTMVCKTMSWFLYEQ